jgi:hypothetical protein
MIVGVAEVFVSALFMLTKMIYDTTLKTDVRYADYSRRNRKIVNPFRIISMTLMFMSFLGVILMSVLIMTILK